MVIVSPAPAAITVRCAPTTSMVPPPMSQTIESGGNPGVVRAPRADASGSVAIVYAGRPVSSANVAAASETCSAASRATTVPRASATPRRNHAPLSIDARSVKNASSTAIPCSAVGIAPMRTETTPPGGSSRRMLCACAGGYRITSPSMLQST